MSEVENVGVVNPRALTEIVLRRRVNWKQHPNPRGLIENTLGVEYRRLFDPANASPLYLGMELRGDHTLKRVRINVDRMKLSAHGEIRPITMRGRKYTFDAGRLRATLQELFHRVDEQEWNPPGVTWADPGDFFHECTEFSDPRQGALADCYLIAALSAVAWADPYTIAHRCRATGSDQEEYVDLVQLYRENEWYSIEVTEKMPLTEATHGWRYARSMEVGEIWPAVYEKAYAKWKTGSTSDRPDMTAIAFGDPGLALSELTGRPHEKFKCEDLTAHEIYSVVRANSRGRKTINPMNAWTYPTAAAAPDGVSYADANLVANHAYTVLGWHYHHGKRYIVLRNPWGWKEADVEVAAGTWYAHDSDYWRPVVLGDAGIFALQAPTFKAHFKKIAVAT